MMARPVRAVGGSEWSVLALNPTGRAVPLAAVGVSAASWGCPVGRKVGNPTGRLGGLVSGGVAQQRRVVSGRGRVAR